MKGSTEDYEYLKQANKFRPKEILEDSVPLVLPNLTETPGVWIYQDYFDKRLSIIRVLYIISIITEIIAFFLGIFFTGYDFTNVLILGLSVDRTYDLIGWGLILALELFFFSFITKKRYLATDLVAESLGYAIFLAYIIMIVYLPARGTRTNISIDISNAILLICLLYTSDAADE